MPFVKVARALKNALLPTLIDVALGVMATDDNAENVASSVLLDVAREQTRIGWETGRAAVHRVDGAARQGSRRCCRASTGPAASLPNRPRRRSAGRVAELEVLALVVIGADVAFAVAE